MHHWCLERRGELVEAARDKSPVLVYNEEVLNDAVFDLLSVEGVERVFQNVEWVRMPEVLRKIYDMGAGFRVRCAAELDSLHHLIPALDPCRLLLVRRGDGPEDDAHDLDSAMYVAATSDALNAGAGPAAKALLRVPVKGETFFSPILEPSLAAKLSGVFLEPEGSDFVHLKDLLPGLSELISQVPPILCLGDGLGLPIDRETDRIHTATLAEQVEEVMEVCAGPRLWVEPGRHLVSHAGILLARATDLEGQNLDLCRMHGARPCLHNLSRPDAGDGRLSLQGTKKDDILVVTNVGALPTEADQNLAALPRHYLKARRICRVRL